MVTILCILEKTTVRLYNYTNVVASRASQGRKKQINCNPVYTGRTANSKPILALNLVTKPDVSSNINGVSMIRGNNVFVSERHEVQGGMVHRDTLLSEIINSIVSCVPRIVVSVKALRKSGFVLPYYRGIWWI